jgi:hypothetical protein
MAEVVATAAAPAGAADAGAAGAAFCSLESLRCKLQADLRGPPASRDFQLRLLLEQDRDCEQGALGCLRDALADLDAARRWGLIEDDAAERRRAALHAAAAEELACDKGLVITLAKEYGLLEEFDAAMSRPVNADLAAYDSIGVLEFALLAWVANLRQALALARAVFGGSKGGDGERILAEQERRVARAWADALRCVARCLAAGGGCAAAPPASGGAARATARATAVARALLGDACARAALPPRVAAAAVAAAPDPDALPLLGEQEAEGEEAAGAPRGGGEEEEGLQEALLGAHLL